MGILIQLLVDWLTGDMLVFWTGLYAVAATLTLFVLAVAAWIALRQTGEAVRLRHSALMADLSKRWDEEPLVQSRRAAARFDDGVRLRLHVEIQEREQSDELFVLQRIPNFFEDLAVLEREGAISFAMIQASFGRLVVDAWKTWAQSVEFWREEEGDDTVYEHFEALARRIDTETPPARRVAAAAP